jgi:hypothetical protein
LGGPPITFFIIQWGAKEKEVENDRPNQPFYDVKKGGCAKEKTWQPPRNT